MDQNRPNGTPSHAVYNHPDGRLDPVLGHLKRPLRWTRIGLLIENATRAFWPLWSLIIFALAVFLFGGFAILPPLWAAGLGAIFGLGAIAGFGFGTRRFVWPTRNAAIARVDAQLPHQPLAALLDRQSIGHGDPASRAVWQAHQKRMKQASQNAKPVKPNLQISNLDPWGLRILAVIFLAVSVFSATLSPQSPGALLPRTGGDTLASGPGWEGWISPPAYTGQPTLYLNDLMDEPELHLLAGARVAIRLWDTTGALTLDQSVAPEAVTDPTQMMEFTVNRSGRLAITGADGAEWGIFMLTDAPPLVQFSALEETTLDGELRQAFYASDDYEITGGEAQIVLDLEAVERRFGLIAEPDARAPTVFDLPLPISGSRVGFEEVLTENFAEHPWAGLPIQMQLAVNDAPGQIGQSAVGDIILPSRKFFNPVAASIIDVRREILWARANGPRGLMVLRAITHRPEQLELDASGFLTLRFAMSQLETALDTGGLTPSAQTEIAQALWDVALRFEEGSLGDAEARMKRAQDRLAEAMERGASSDEIAELMDELRDATRDYLEQLAQNAPTDQPLDQAQNQNQDSQTLSQQDLDDLMNQIQELMEQGRMEEAQQLLDMLREMMENLEVTQGGQGSGDGQNPGEQAMQGLQDTLRDQQGLSDEAFRELQEQYNPGAQSGQSDQNTGRNGGQGQGQSHEGGGSGEGANDQGTPGENGQTSGGNQGQSLEERQQALRQALEDQRNALPEIADGATEDALDRAGRAMDQAGDALGQDDLARALEQQAQAMDALREGMQSLGEAMAENQQGQQPGQQGPATAQSSRNAADPFGREAGTSGAMGTETPLGDGTDPRQQARELMEDLRQRSQDQSRPKAEREYLKRLLEQE